MGKRLVPKADWILGEHKATEERSEGGLFIPAVANSYDEVTVIETGPAVTRCKPGDKIIYVQGRLCHKQNGRALWLIQDEHVIASVENA